MNSISTAIGLERRARVRGYSLKRGFFDNTTGNLGQMVAVLGEANTANQTELDTEGRVITSAVEAGEIYGFGSPIHQMFRILRPTSGDGIGGIPTVVFPQISDAAATPTVHEWTVTGTATSNTSHRFSIAGRESLEFQNYDFSIQNGDSENAIAARMADAINSILESPVSATVAANVVTLTTKWSGLTSASLSTKINVGSNNAGLTYVQSAITPGAGLVDLVDSLNQFEDNWYTFVVNPYGQEQFETLEQFNGIPNDTQPTGRYEGRIFMPFVALFGSTLDDRDDITAITNSPERVRQVTNALCPAPRSEGFPWEAAANVARLFARTAQDTPHLDINNLSYPDMPTPQNGQIGDMADYNNRDLLVKAGSSTVIFENGAYVVQDMVTTYHPAGETPLQYAYVRNLMVDWNIADAYRILERRFVLDKVIIRDDQVSDARNVIKPSEWRGIARQLFAAFAERALINEPDFSSDSLLVQISEVDPNRFETFFRYRRTGVARISSTDVEAGF